MTTATSKLSFWALIALVVGSMVGAGIFSLPQTFGRATGPLGAIIAWTIAGAGMLALALTFQVLARRKPEIEGGVYGYARAGFGAYLGFNAALGYWIVGCLGNVSYLVLIKSTLGAVIPAFGDGNTVHAVAVSSVLLWSVHFLILRGVKEAATINTIATVAKLVPIAVFILVAALAFDGAVLEHNLAISGGLEPGPLFEQVRSTMLITVFVFVGIEGASIYSRYAKNPNDVGTATVLGFVGVLALLVLVTMLSYGILARPELAALRNPSMAGVLQAIVGSWGAVFISVGLIVSVSGAFLSWSLLAAEVLYSAAHTGTMPRFLARENVRKVPANAVLLTNIVIQTFLISTLFSEDAFTAALKMTSAMILIPYLLVAAYALKLAWTGETYASQTRSRRVDLARGAFTTLYVLGMIYAGGLKFVLLSSLIYAPGVILFVIAQREQNRRLFGFSELLVFGAAVAAALVAIWGLYSGSISL